MKKAIVLLLALMMVGFVFAEEAKPAYDIVADATATWGYDVETGATGFTNEMNFELTFPLVAGATAETTGENVYGQLKITGINLALYNDGTDSKVFDNYDEDGYYDDFEAKIVMGPAYVTIYSAPDFELNTAVMVGPKSQDDWDDASIIAKTAGTSGGIAIGYKNDMLDFAVQVASNGDWTATDAVAGTVTYVNTVATAAITEAAAITAGYYNPTTGLVWAVGDGNISVGELYIVKTTTGAEAAIAKNEDNHYTLGFTASVTPIEMLTIDAAAFMDTYDTGNKGFTLGLTLAPIDGLEVTAGFDAYIAGALDMVWDTAFGTTYTFGNANEVAFNAYFAPADSFGTVNAYTEIGFSFTEDGAEGFVPALGFSAYVNAYDLLDKADTGGAFTDGLPLIIGGTVDYTVTIAEGKTVKPYAEFDMGLLEYKDAFKAAMGDFGNSMHFVVGLEAAVIANTTITAEFEAGAINDNVVGAIGTVTGSDLEKGAFTLACTIEL